MRPKFHAWLRFFRVVNLPTVPGDVFVGAAAAQADIHCELSPAVLAAACLASILLYMFGLADNDIVGAAADKDRPIPQGLISMRAARIARALCLLGAIGLGLVARLPRAWWFVACGVAVAIVIYNRTKWPLMMGLCRGADLLLGTAALGGLYGNPVYEGVSVVPFLGLFILFTAYIASVTKYSEGEEMDPARKRRVGRLIGALVWLQLVTILLLVVFNMDADLVPEGLVFIPLQLAMIALLGFLKHLMPKVSAS